MVNPVHADFQYDLRRIFIGVLAQNTDEDGVRDIQKMTEFELVACYDNWCRRRITRQPRRLIESKEFSASMQNLSYCTQVNGLLSKIESGKDITCHLSKSIVHAYVHRDAPKPLGPSRRPDLDLMLNEWGIHHLHVSDEMEPGNTGFVKRDGPLMFAIFCEDRVYLIDILGHDFTNDRLFRVIVANWPDDRLVQRLEVLPGLLETAEERRALRSVGLNTVINIDGHAYVSAMTGGMTTAGISTLTSIRAKQFIRGIIAMESNCNNLDFIQKLYSTVGLTCPMHPKLHLALSEGGWGIVDGQSGILLRRI